jgi:hypothetical protein
MSAPMISGFSPYYVLVLTQDRCYLSEATPSSGTCDYKCKSNSNFKTCGNFEVKTSRSNYKNK